MVLSSTAASNPACRRPPVPARTTLTLSLCSSISAHASLLLALQQERAVARRPLVVAETGSSLRGGLCWIPLMQQVAQQERGREQQRCELTQCQHESEKSRRRGV